MYNYDIEIIDNWDTTGTNLSQRLLARSIILRHDGGDRIDNPIIGSSLSWTFVGLDCRDGKYKQLFTGDENRFRVNLRESDSQTLIWSGFLLPDSYSEPYRNYVQDVSFLATDGLGRLKGKFLDNLPPEISVIDGLTRILSLTGVGLNMRFAPGIVNYSQKNFKQIWLPTEGWTERSAYSILESICTSLGSTMMQTRGFWSLEGWNIRALPMYYANEYSAGGSPNGGYLVSRHVKEASVKAGGNIVMQPPYGVIEITREVEPISLPEGLYRPVEEDWVSYGAAEDSDTVYVNEWVMTTGFPVLSDGEVVFFGRADDGQVSLKKKPYLQEGEKYKFHMEFELRKDDEDEDIEFTRNPFLYQIRVDDQVIYSNSSQGTRLDLINSPDREEIQRTFEFRARQSGLFDIVIFPLQGDVEDNNIKDVVITEMTLEHIGFDDDTLTRRITNENYTTVKQVYLEYADDVTGKVPAFRLGQLDTPTDFTRFSTSSKRFFQYDGLWHYVVDLRTAQLVANNLNSVSDIMGPVDIDRVEFNWMGGQEHVIISPDFFFHSIGGQPTIRINVNSYNPFPGEREYWEAWSDSLYGIEQKHFVDAYTDFLARLFSHPLERADVTLRDNIKISDVLHLNYEGEKSWVFSSVTWDIDAGETTLVATRSPIDLAQLGPVVVIDGNKFLVDGETELVAEAYSPSGTIVSYNWEVVSGNATITPTNQREVTVDSPDYVIDVRVTVTDSYGRTATDTIQLFSKIDVTFEWVLVSGSEQFAGPRPIGGNPTYELRATPALPDEYVVLLRGSILISLTNTSLAGPGMYDDGMTIEINGDEVFNTENTKNDGVGPLDYLFNEEFALAFTGADTVTVSFNLDERTGQDIGGMNVDPAYADFEVGYGNIITPPLIGIQSQGPDY